MAATTDKMAEVLLDHAVLEVKDLNSTENPGIFRFLALSWNPLSWTA
jgi:hypothetical protein